MKSIIFGLVMKQYFPIKTNGALNISQIFLIKL